MLDRPQGSGFTIAVAGSEADDVSRTSSGGSQPGNAGDLGFTEPPSLQQHSRVGTSPLSGAAEAHGVPPARTLAMPAPRPVGAAEQTCAGAARTANGRLAQHGVGKVEVMGSQAQQLGPEWRQADSSVKGGAGTLPALPDGGNAPTTPSMEGRRTTPPPGAAASATSSLTESAALDVTAHVIPGLQAGSVPAVKPTLADRLEAASPLGVAETGAAQQGFAGRAAGAVAKQALQQGAGLAAALGRHEDWGSAWGAGLSVLPSGASVSDASAASPVSSMDLIAPRPSCIVDVAAEPIVSAKGEPSPPCVIDQMLRTALRMADVEEDLPTEGGTSLKTVSNAADAGDSPRIRTLLPMQLHPQQQRRTLVTRSADTASRKDECYAPGQTTGRSSAPVISTPWRTVVPTSVFALSEPGPEVEAAALATRWELPRPDCQTPIKTRLSDGAAMTSGHRSRSNSHLRHGCVAMPDHPPVWTRSLEFLMVTSNGQR
jgi:hypothetical protein